MAAQQIKGERKKIVVTHKPCMYVQLALRLSVCLIVVDILARLSVGMSVCMFVCLSELYKLYLSPINQLEHDVWLAS